MKRTLENIFSLPYGTLIQFKSEGTFDRNKKKCAEFLKQIKKFNADYKSRLGNK